MITVFGYLGRVTPELAAAVTSAEVVVGGRRHLEAVGVEEARSQVLGPLEPAVERLEELPADRNAVVIASGDPLLFGIVRRLRASGLSVRVVPEVSSAAAAFAAVSVPWDDARLVSAHQQGLPVAVNLCRAWPKVGVLTGPGRGLPELVTALGGEERWYVLAERLGEDDRQVRILDAAAARKVVPVEPNVVLVLREHPDAQAVLGQTPQLVGGYETGAVHPASAFDPAAALAYGWLRPRPGELVVVEGILGRSVAAMAASAGVAVSSDVPQGYAEADVAVLESLPEDSPDGRLRALVCTGSRVPDWPGWSFRISTVSAGEGADASHTPLLLGRIA